MDDASDLEFASSSLSYYKLHPKDYNHPFYKVLVSLLFYRGSECSTKEAMYALSKMTKLRSLNWASIASVFGDMLTWHWVLWTSVLPPTLEVMTINTTHHKRKLSYNQVFPCAEMKESLPILIRLNIVGALSDVDTLCLKLSTHFPQLLALRCSMASTATALVNIKELDMYTPNSIESGDYEAARKLLTQIVCM